MPVLFCTKNAVCVCRREDEEESLSKLPDYDLNSDGHISWSELLKAVYGYDEQDVAQWATDENKEVQELYRVFDNNCNLLL